MKQIRVILFLVVLMVSTIVCGTPSQNAPPLFARTAGLIKRIPDLPPQSTVWVLDRQNSFLQAITGTGAAKSIPLATPPNGWPQTQIDGWQLSDDIVSLVVPGNSKSTWLAEVYLTSATMTSWRAAVSSHVIILDSQLVEVTGNALDTGGKTILLPGDVAAYPEVLSSGGFPYISTDQTLNWWDPVSGVIVWRQPISTDVSAFSYIGNQLTWTQSGKILYGESTTSGLGNIHWAPSDAAVIALRFEGANTDTIWAATIDAKLHRLSLGIENRLCYVNNSDGGSMLQGPNFFEAGAISSPEFISIRLDIENCPGWTLSDAWVASFSIAPTLWQGITVNSATTITDIPKGELLSIGTIFSGSDFVDYRLESTAPITWAPTMPGAITGDLTPQNAWVFESQRQGLLGIVDRGGTLQLENIEIRIDEGSDPSDTGDRFTFNTISGVQTFQGSRGLNPWEWLDSGLIVALDRKTNTVYIFDRNTNENVVPPVR